MATATDLLGEIDSIIATQWAPRDGRTVPDTQDITFRGGAVDLAATFLYADLRGSSSLASGARYISCEIFQSFLSLASRIIRDGGGEIRSFDGDRVMGVFIGDYKNTSAVKCAFRITWAVTNALLPRFQAAYSDVANGKYTIGHATGIDTGPVRTIRAGVRNNSDLVFVGEAASKAAKLSGLRDVDTTACTYITPAVYNVLHDSGKIWGATRENMWQARTWGAETLYRSTWWWKPETTND